MIKKIKRDRQLLKAFLLLLFLSSSVFLYMGVDETSAKYVGKFFFKVFFGIIVLLLLLSIAYLYKICKQCYSSSAVSWIMVILFAGCFFSKFSLITFIIGIFIIWKSKKLLMDTE